MHDSSTRLTVKTSEAPAGLKEKPKPEVEESETPLNKATKDRCVLNSRNDQ